MKKKSDSEGFSDFEQFKISLIRELFDKEDKVPVADVLAYDLPLDFWVYIRDSIKRYEEEAYPAGLYNRLCESLFFNMDTLTLFDELETSNPGDINHFHLTNFRAVLAEYIGIQDIKKLDRILYCLEYNFIEQEGLTRGGFVGRLCSFYLDYSEDEESHPYRVLVKQAMRKEQQKFSQAKRDITRKKYVEWDSRLTDRFFQEAEFIEYPALMLDRIVLQVYSDTFMTWRKPVKTLVATGAANFLKDAVAESRGYNVSQLRTEFDDIDVEKYLELFGNDLDDRFDIMKTRSIVGSLDLSDKPKLVDKSKAGGSISYYFKEEGCTFWFIAKPASAGGPLSLMVSANMQTRVFRRLVRDYPNIQEAYDEEFLHDPNFIPMGYEDLYCQYEQDELNRLKDKALSVYALMLERLGVPPDVLRTARIKSSINQVEVCWNNDLPLDPVGYMVNVMRYLESWGFYASSLNDKTPMFVTKYVSDIQPGTNRFTHKRYVKTKRNLRQELQFFGELKHPCSFRAEGMGVGPGCVDKSDISRQFFVNSDRIKRYLYAKYQFHLHRRTEGFPEAPESFDIEAFSHGYHKHNRALKPLDEEGKRRFLQRFLEGSELPEPFRDLGLFNAFVFRIKQDGYITRKFFTPKKGRGWSNKKFEACVSESPHFERISRGKYRPVSKHDKRGGRCYFKQFIDDYYEVLEEWGITE